MADLGPTDRLELARREVKAAARRLEDLAGVMASRTLRLAGLAAKISLTSAQSPPTAGAAQVFVGWTTAGPTGTVSQALALAGTAHAITAAVSLSDEADAAVAAATPTLERLAGGWLDRLPAPIRETATSLVDAFASSQPAASVTAGIAGATGVGGVAPWLAPRTPRDLVAQLGATGAAGHDAIDIVTLTPATGPRHHIVYLPGTDSMNPEAIRNWQTNAAWALGTPTTYADGVRAALTAAGVQPSEPVLLVGYSQGGLVAAEVARDPGPHTISQILTLGAPLGPDGVPAAVGVLAFEHVGDLVPLADRAPNASVPGHVTVTFADGMGSPADNHSLSHYVAGAEAAQDSDDPQVQAAIGDLGGFLAPGSTVKPTRWLVERGEE